MRVGVFRGVRTVTVEAVTEPHAGPRDVVLRVETCGICGHEFAGEVVEVGAPNAAPSPSRTRTSR